MRVTRPSYLPSILAALSLPSLPTPPLTHIAPMPTSPSLITHVSSLVDDPTHSDYIKKEEDRPQIAPNTFAQIPVISLASLVCERKGGDEVGRRQQGVAEVMKACEEWGMFQVREHGVPKELVQRMVGLTHQFFALPPAEKLRYVCDEPSPSGKFRGYGHGSFVKGDPVADWRELLLAQILPPSWRNQHEWPAEPPCFRETLLEYSREMLRVGEVLVEAISEGLGLGAKAVREASGEMEERILLNYYPACPQPSLTLGLRRHTDPGTITLLHQDDVGGLETTRDGETWVAVEPLEGAFVVNLGDHMNVLSNNRLRNAEHRVIVNSSSTRVTIATFFNPAADSLVCPLVQDANQPSLEPCTFIEFYRRRIPQQSK